VAFKDVSRHSNPAAHGEPHWRTLTRTSTSVGGIDWTSHRGSSPPNVVLQVTMLVRAVRRESEVGKVPVIPRLPDKSKDLRDARPVEPQSEGSVPVRFLPTKDKAVMFCTTWVVVFEQVTPVHGAGKHGSTLAFEYWFQPDTACQREPLVAKYRLTRA